MSKFHFQIEKTILSNGVTGVTLYATPEEPSDPRGTFTNDNVARLESEMGIGGDNLQLVLQTMLDGRVREFVADVNEEQMRKVGFTR